MRTLLLRVSLLFIVWKAFAGEIPFLAGRVNDQAGILSSSTVAELDSMLKAEEDSTSNQVAVLTVKSLEGEALEAYSMRVVESWKLGQKGKDNGVLLLVVRDDRKVRIEVGRGLEGPLPDITCGTIIRKEIIPRFKQGDFDGGVNAGVVAILGSISGSYKAAPEGTSDLAPILAGSLVFIIVVGLFTFFGVTSHGPLSWVLFVFLIPFWFGFPAALFGVTTGAMFTSVYVIVFFLVKGWFTKSPSGQSSRARWARSMGMWPIGGSGWGSTGGWSSGGGFSGGGGSFSGGGASGSW